MRMCVVNSTGMQREKLAVANTIRTSDVLFALLWQWLFTNDVVSVVELIGSMFVLVGILVIIIFRDSRLRDSEEDVRSAITSKENIAYSSVSLNQFDEL